MSNDAIVFLPLSQGHVAIIDFVDFERLGRFKWSFKQSKYHGYAVRQVKGIRHWLHKEVLGAGGLVDHRNGDRLDNRRENLRPSDNASNQRAYRRKSDGKTSVYRGVSWDTERVRWVASIEVDGVKQFVGRFPTEEDAARARDRRAESLGFPVESMNFPDEYGRTPF